MAIKLNRIPVIILATATILILFATVTQLGYYNPNVMVRGISQTESTEMHQNQQLTVDKTSSKTLSSEEGQEAPLEAGVPKEVNISKVTRNDTGQLAFSCVSTHLKDLTLPVCIYNAEEDRHVSKAFSKGTYWESENVMSIMKFIDSITSQYSSLSFMDLGANLGAYSLPLAKLGLNVLSVEPNWNTLTRLAKSASLNNVNNNMKIYHNAVSDSRGSLHLEQDTTNRGNTFVSDCAHENRRVWWRRLLDYMLGREFRCLNETLETVLLDDFADKVPNNKVIMKIDVQCAEIRVLNRKTSSKFFAKNDVSLIFLEWECYRPGYNKLTDEENILLKDMMEYIYSMNYTVYSETRNILSYEDLEQYSGDNVILIKGINKSLEQIWR